LGTIPIMLFMVIERFKEDNARVVGERFRHSGRMLPEGVVYHESWVEPAGGRCFQVREVTAFRITERLGQPLA
jgi:Protein of unknown function (DUF3303)